jgi:hypothetical protein
MSNLGYSIDYSSKIWRIQNPTVFLYSGAESREHGRVAPRKSFTQ